MQAENRSAPARGGAVMADREGNLIHEPPSPTNPHRPDVERDPPPPPCVACRVVHGGVGAEILCLRTAVRSLGTRLAFLQQAYTREIGLRDRKIEGLEGLLADRNLPPIGSTKV